MNTLAIIFWFFISIIFYSYLGYGIVLYILVKIKEKFYPELILSNNRYAPMVSFIIPCYNEASIISAKIKNTQYLDYPLDKIQIIIITDGSTDGTEKIVSSFLNVALLHRNERKGKSAAVNRAVAYADGDIIIVSDANTALNPDAIKKMMRHYVDPMVGAVSGEKRIQLEEKENAAGAGEGIYWKYESLLKNLDSRLLTMVGAAGELFSFRKHLFNRIEEDTILDDFMLSMRITEKGYLVKYEPEAVAVETSSVNTKEELKRKIRICAGGWQAMSRLKDALNFCKHPLLTFQYVSHRVLRWTLAPLVLFLLLPLNIIMANQDLFYANALIVHLSFYAAASLGWIMENRSIRIKIFFVPYYFLVMNYAALAGYFRFMQGKQSAAWERSERKIEITKQAA
ncbi:glycosyltransferase family 2 protein [soil metagenome]